MSDRLTYYFSTGSRYSYLSMSQLPEIEGRYGVRFDWIPVNGKRIRAIRGADPFRGTPVSGQYDWAYRQRDAEAWADYYAIEFNEPENVDFDVELLLRAVIAAGRQGDVRDYAWALAREVFALGTWPLDQAVAEQVARQCSLDMGAFKDACADPVTQQTLEENCEEAVSRGAFGTPSLFVNDELFWGNDRLVLLRHRLAGGRSHPAPFQVLALDHVVLRSREPESLVRFYSELLHVPVERTVRDFLWQLRVGDGLLDILRARTDQTHGINMDHFCLRIQPYDEENLLDYLRDAGVQAETAGEIYGAQGMGPSIYFTDPEGNRVELKRHKV